MIASHQKAVVLSMRDVGEYDREFTLFTEECGRVRARATGIRKGGAKLTTVLSTGHWVDVELVLGKRWYRVVGALLLDELHLVREEGSRLHRYLLLLNFLNTFLPHDEPEQKIWQCLLIWKDRLKTKGSHQDAPYLDEWFYWQVLKWLGYEPQWWHSVHSGMRLPQGESYRFSFAHGGVFLASERDATSTMPVSTEAIKVLRLMGGTLAPERLALVRGADLVWEEVALLRQRYVQFLNA